MLNTKKGKEESIKLKADLKDLNIELGNLKIVTEKEDNGSSLLTGKDVDVFINGKNFRDTPLKYLCSIDIHIGDADTIASVTYECLPFKSKEEDEDEKETI